MHRYKVILEYIGVGYCGWQKQKESLSLQQVIEDAIFSFNKEKVVVTVAGRTDAGVNAYGQVAHFDLDNYYEPRRLMQSINHFSRPHTVGVVFAEEVNLDFHARFSAKSRHYVYKILNRPSINIINNGFMYWVRHDLDMGKMQEAANFLLGRHDFSSFRASECQSNSPIRTLDKIDIIRQGDVIEIHISALSFLHHMVRNIVGSLVLVGSGKWKPIQIKEVLEAKDRKAAGPTAPACGLYFLKVDY
jgi:tRNA pseudouridine38-40 synthase